MATFTLIVQILAALATLIPKVIELEKAVVSSGIIESRVRNIRTQLETFAQKLQEHLFEIGKKDQK